MQLPKGGQRLAAVAEHVDEYLYWLWPDELEKHVPIIEQLMLDGMRMAIPDVKIGCETTCGWHWDKKATEFLKLEKDENGKYIIKDPEMVTQIYKEKKNGK